MRTPLQLPLGKVNSTAPFVILSEDLQLISEHETGEAACEAIAKFFVRSGYKDAEIFVRTDCGWIDYQ